MLVLLRLNNVNITLRYIQCCAVFHSSKIFQIPSDAFTNSFSLTFEIFAMNSHYFTYIDFAEEKFGMRR